MQKLQSAQKFQLNRSVLISKMQKMTRLLLLMSSVLAELCYGGSAAGLDTGRIVGGEVAEEGEFPWQVSLRVSGAHLGGGALVSVQHVLTAAHCMDGRTIDDTYVVTGTNSLASGGEEHAIKTVHIHGSYLGTMESSLVNDVAVLTLVNAINETSLQRPIALAIEDTLEGIRATVTGWGKTVYPSNSRPTLLQKMDSTIVNNTICQEIWADRTTIYDSHLCALEDYGIGACDGDSGSPMVYNNQVVGIVSLGASCALGIPDVYTRVYYHLYWIGSIIYNTEARSDSENTLDVKETVFL